VLAAGPAEALAARTDLPALSARRDAGVLVPCTVLGTQDGLATLGFAGGALVTTARPGPPGTRLRVRLRARDIAIATVEPRGLSTQNVLPVTIAAIDDAPDPGEAFVRLAAGPTTLLARIARDSVARLGLRPGLAAWALIKAVTFDRRAAPPGG
jgi:molybdate transport system ATP-binding protein